MAIQTTSNLSSSVRAQYIGKYFDGAKSMRLYDQLSVPYTNFSGGLSMDELMRSSSIYIPFLSTMTPGVTAISQTQDTTPQTLYDTTASITWTSLGESLQWSKQLDIEAYTDYTARAYERIGQNAAESIEILALAAACKGTWVERAAARTSLDAGTVAHNASDSLFRKFHAKMLSLKVPGFINDAGEANTWMAIMHPYVFHDISESGNVDSIGLYQNQGIHLNFELAQVGPFRLVVSPWAKVFYGVGANNATDSDTTVATAVVPLDTTVVTAADEAADSAYGEFLTVGTLESSTTFYPTNERVKFVSASTTTITIIGEGPNGGFRYPHAVGDVVHNADSAYTIVFGGPESLVKVFATDVGEFGEVIGPKISGNLDQFNTLSWRYWGNYGRFAENRLLRYECSVSYEA